MRVHWDDSDSEPPPPYAEVMPAGNERSTIRLRGTRGHRRPGGQGRKRGWVSNRAHSNLRWPKYTTAMGNDSTQEDPVTLRQRTQLEYWNRRREEAQALAGNDIVPEDPIVRRQRDRLEYGNKHREAGRTSSERGLPARTARHFLRFLLFLLMAPATLLYIISAAVVRMGRAQLRWIDRATLLAILLAVALPTTTALRHERGQTGQGADGQSRTLEVCDCESKNMRFVKVDLTSVEDCPDPEKDYEDKYPKRIALLQTDTSEAVKVYACEVKFSKVVTRCGLYHHTYGTKVIEDDRPLELTAGQCRKMVREKMYRASGTYLGGDPPLMMLEPNVWRVSSYYSRGSWKKSGHCTWDSWKWERVSYTNSYEQTIIKVRIREVTGIYKSDTGKMFIEALGLRVTYADEADTDMGMKVVWSRQNSTDCTQRLSKIYEGIANVHLLRPDKRKSKDLYEGGIVTFQDDKTKQVGGFVVRRSRDGCVDQCSHTHIPGLIVCLDPKRLDPNLVFKPATNVQHKMLQVAVSHHAMTTSFAMDEKFVTVHNNICNVQRRGTMHQLGDLAHNKNPYAMRQLDVPGIGTKCRQWIPGGSSGYIAMCPIALKTWTNFPNCTLEIPVKDMELEEVLPMDEGTKGDSHFERQKPIIQFADPLTFVLQRFPTIVPCSQMMPVRWKIAEQWHCVTETATGTSTIPCEAPQKVSAAVGDDVEMTRPGDFDSLGGGLYTPEQIRRNNEFIQETRYREPVIATLVTKMTEGSGPVIEGGTVKYGLPFDGPQLDNLSYQVAARILPAFAFVGKSYTIIVGFLFILAVCKLALGIVLRVYVLWRRKGFGVWMFTAFWATAFTLFGMPWKVAKDVYKGVTDEVDHVLENQDQVGDGLLMKTLPPGYGELKTQMRGLLEAQEASQRVMRSRDQAIRLLIEGTASTDGPQRALAREVLDELERAGGGAGPGLHDFNPDAAPRNNGGSSAAK